MPSLVKTIKSYSDGSVEVVSETPIPPAAMLSAPTPTHIVRKWGDPAMMDLMGYNTNNVGGNFQVVALATPDGMEAVQQFQILDATAMNLLKSLQKAGLNTTYDQNMNWLCSSGEGRPYWTEGRIDESKPSGWKQGNWIRFLFGTLVFGGQKIAVEMAGGVPVEYSLFLRYKARDNKEWITFYKLEGLRRADIPLVYSGAISHASHPHLIQKGTGANAGGAGNVYTAYPDDPKYHVVWDARDWSSNNGNALYIAKAFVL